MDWESTDNGYTLITSLDELNRLKPALKNELLDKCSHFADDYSEILLDELHIGLVLEVSNALSSKDNNARRSRRRNEVEMSMSAGYSTPSDIQEIIKLQDQRCYFTGEELSLTKKNWELDHLTPVSKGGSSWPGNLAVLSKTANQVKGDCTKQKYWEILETRYGKKWVTDRKGIVFEIDKNRKKIHAARVRELKDDLSRIESILKSEFEDHYISLVIENDIICMIVDGTEIFFPKGLPRKRTLFKTPNYFYEVVSLFTF